MKPVILLGEARGEAEAKLGVGFVGASGVELIRMLNESGLIELTETDFSYISRYYDTGDNRCIDAVWRLHPEVHRTNVFQQHPPGNKIEWFCGPKSEAIPGYPQLIKSKFVREEFSHELERLGDELHSLDPNLVVCFGNTALWALCGQTGVTKLRGTTQLSTHTISGYKCLATYHPAAVLRQWELRPVTIADLTKAKRESEFPEVRRPKCQIWIEPSLTDLETFYASHIPNCSILSVDIETAGNQVTCIGFAPNPGVALVVPFSDTREKGKSYWPDRDHERKAWDFVKRILEDRTIPKLFQNGLYDISFLWTAYGIKTLGAAEDTMLLHHALQPESLKGLGFLGSVYTDHGPWKSERKGTTTIKRDE